MDKHPEPASRLHARVDVMLEQYEPDEERLSQRRERLRSALELLALLTLAVMLMMELNITSTWAAGLLGAVVATGAHALHWAWSRARDRAEQDEAVNQVVVGGKVVERDEARSIRPVTSPPAEATD